MNTLESVKQLGDMYLEYAKGGRQFYFKAPLNSWTPSDYFPAIDSNLDQWELRPIAKKPVDLSVLIKSGILCEFDAGEQNLWIGKLSRIGSGYYSMDMRGACQAMASVCRPLMDHWHSWQGGECPLPDGVMVSVLHRKAPSKTLNATGLSWGWFNKEPDIIQFKVTGLVEGYCWPWDA